VLSALLEARSSGQGQVVDAAMVDGAASLMTLIYGFHAAGYWKDERGTNRLDSGAPWYNTYETRDGKHVSIAANEARFYQEALRVLGLNAEDLPDQHDQTSWPLMKTRFTEIFKTHTRDEWVALAAGTQSCIVPVLSLAEAPHHPHIQQRGSFVEVDGVVQPGPAPRFSRTPGAIQNPPPRPGQDSDAVLSDWGFSEQERQAMRSACALL
jgi:alpha-methylacyl-CoA racemase